MEKKEKQFGTFLRETRKSFEISLRKFAEEAALDPAYLSRVEGGKILRPGREIIDKIAETLCQRIHLKAQLILSDTYNPEPECEELKRQLLLKAGYKLSDAELLGFKSDQSATTEDLFADRLRDKGVAEEFVLEAMKKVPQHLMTKVLSGEESLYSWLKSKDSDSDYIKKNLGNLKFKNPAVIESKFQAGARAFIQVDGDLSSSQEKQLRVIATLVKSILVAGEKVDKLEAQVKILTDELDEMKSKGNK